MSLQSHAEHHHSLTLLLCGGGTGGHVYPALAVAQALRGGDLLRGTAWRNVALPSQQAGEAGQHQQVSEQAFRQSGGSARVTEADQTTIAHDRPSVVYVGSADGMEAGLVQQESDLPFQAISAAAVRGRNPLALAKSVAVMARGTLEARRLLRRLRPAAILGTGGYVCVPLFLAARSLGIPTVIYLPDVVPGLAVKSLARIATVVACNVEDSARYFSSKIVVTGYPVRAELFTQQRAACRAAFGLVDDLPVVFVYGGSRGARSVNQAIAALLPHLLPIAHIIHVCGREGDETFLREAAARLPEQLRGRYQLYPYLYSEGSGVRRQGSEDLGLTPDPRSPIPTMTSAFGAADLAVCRSGASTMAELPAAGLPAVLVPYPFVHQEENADYLVARGAAVKIQDADMLGSGLPEHGPLFQHVRRLLLAHEERFRMSERSRMLARPQAAQHLAEVLLDLATSTRTER